MIIGQQWARQVSVPLAYCWLKIPKLWRKKVFATQLKPEIMLSIHDSAHLVMLK